jgi:hypothetical protein
MILTQPVILNPVFAKVFLFSGEQGEGSYSDLY